MHKLTPQFAFFKGMPIAARIRWILAITAIGFALQLLVSPVVGWFAVFAAALMATMEGKSNEPSITARGDWQTVTVEEVDRARKLLASTSRVRSEGSTAGVGCLTAFLSLLIGLVLFVAVDTANVTGLLLPVLRGGPVSLPFVLDALTFAIVIWLSGRPAAWEPPDLRTKLDQIGMILAIRKDNPQLEFLPSLQLATTKNGNVPVDVKLLVKIKDADPNFMGIQVQVSFNQVQGRSLPYTYCVLLARPEFELTKRTQMIEQPPRGGFPVGFLGLFADDNSKRESHFARFHGSLIELKREGEVDIAVVRQDTSEPEGYTTSPNQALEVFSDAYVLAKQMLETAP